MNARQRLRRPSAARQDALYENSEGPRSSRPLALVHEQGQEPPSGQRIKAGLPVVAHYRLRWAYQELDVPAGTEFSIGRAPECLLRLASNSVSRHHARFTHGDNGPMIEDLGSLNGVLVNQCKIRDKTLLRHGDAIQIGVEELKLFDADRIDACARRSTLRVGPGQGGSARGSHTTAVPPSLTELGLREREVLKSMLQGNAPSEVAEHLQLNSEAVETCLRGLARRLDCRTHQELVSYAICAGLLREI